MEWVLSLINSRIMFCVIKSQPKSKRCRPEWLRASVYEKDEYSSFKQVFVLTQCLGNFWSNQDAKRHTYGIQADSKL